MSSFERRPSPLRLLLPVGLMVAITIASSRPGTALPQLGFQFADKLVHAAAFGTLGFLWAFALSGRARCVVISVVICVVFGALDEIHQSTVPGRFPDFFDAVADTVGAILGVALFRGVLRLRARSRSAGNEH